jgi:hypothetical protein
MLFIMQQPWVCGDDGVAMMLHCCQIWYELYASEKTTIKTIKIEMECIILVFKTKLIHVVSLE